MNRFFSHGLSVFAVLGIAMLVPSAHSAEVIFSANPSGSWHLFAMPLDGSSIVQLGHTTADEHSAAVGPNNLRIAFSTSDGSLWTAILATQKATKLPLPPGRYAHPTWLPDGSGIVFTAYTVHPPDDEDSDLYVYNFKEGKKKLFLKQAGSQDYAAISPDGSQIAYVSSVVTLIPGLEGIINQQLWVASLRENKAGPLFPTTAKDRDPAWAPDGKHLAFCSDRNGKYNIWITDPEGHELTQLTDDPASATSPAWSPDGKEIVYVSTSSGRSELRIVNVATREVRDLRPFGSKPVEVRDPQWR